MSVVVGVIRDGVAVIASDTARFVGNVRTVGGAKYHIVGSYAVGYTGTVKWGEFVRSLDDGLAVEQIAESWHMWAAERSHGKQDADGDHCLTGELLVVSPHGLWRIGPDCGVARVRGEYAAIGSGAPTAYGAMCAAPALPAWDVAQKAIGACVRHHVWCGGEMALATIGGGEVG